MKVGSKVRIVSVDSMFHSSYEKGQRFIGRIARIDALFPEIPIDGAQGMACTVAVDGFVFMGCTSDLQEVNE
jgi:hypothetical protein